MEWISVKDKLPVSELVITAVKYLDGEKEYEIITQHLSEHSPKMMVEGYNTLGNMRIRKITHWMPLPPHP